MGMEIIALSVVIFLLLVYMTIIHYWYLREMRLLIKFSRAKNLDDMVYAEKTQDKTKGEELPIESREIEYSDLSDEDFKKMI